MKSRVFATVAALIFLAPQAWSETYPCPLITIPMGLEEPPELLLEWGSPGSGPGEFNRANAIDVDHLGNVYVTEYRSSRLQKFSGDGAFLKEWDIEDDTSVGGLTVDQRGNVYVVGKRYNRDGVLVLEWDARGSAIAADSDGNIYTVGNKSVYKYRNNGTFLAEWSGNGFGFGEPRAIAVDGSVPGLVEKEKWRILRVT